MSVDFKTVEEAKRYKRNSLTATKADGRETLTKLAQGSPAPSQV